MVSFGLLWFLIMLFPFLGIFRFSADIAEHWLYIASFGFFLAISQIRFLKNKVVIAIAVLILGALTLQRNFIWRDDISIYQDALKYNPNNHKLLYNLGNAYLRRGMVDEATGNYLAAIKVNPNYADALNNLGIALEEQGRHEEAYEYYKMAFEVDSNLEVARWNLLTLEELAFADTDEVSFDHGRYREVLAEFVEDGRVDYARLKDNSLNLDKYLGEVAKFDLRILNSMGQDEQITFYINIYNALTLKTITNHYPVKSIRDIPGVWDKLRFKVAGQELTLNQIEHEVLRKRFTEPRIHFALNCASIGCPILPSKPIFKHSEGTWEKTTRAQHKAGLLAPKTRQSSSI